MLYSACVSHLTQWPAGTEPSICHQRLGRGDSALPQAHEMRKRRLGLGRGNMGVRRRIQGWQSL